MNIKFLIPSLLILVFTPAFGALSDATGLLNRFDIETGGHVFEVKTTANFDVKEVTFDKDQKKLTLYMISSLEDNLGEVIIPRGLLSGNFTFYLNDESFQPEVKSNKRITFITLNYTGIGSNKLDIFATNYLENMENKTESVMVNGSSGEKNPANGGGCLIATATFDSELAPEVQKLRELRDTKLLQTNSGSIFLNNFNNFYYLFSPQIADLERENPMFKEFVKITITPLLWSLSILNNVSMNSEFEVIGYGSSLILLNIGMYFVAPTLVLMRFTKN